MNDCDDRTSWRAVSKALERRQGSNHLPSLNVGRTPRMITCMSLYSRHSTNCISSLAMIFSVVIGAVIIILLLIIIYLRYTKYPKYVSVEGKSVLITGCDTGFGNALAKRLDKLGIHVMASCLDAKGEGATSLGVVCSKRLIVIGLDVSCDRSVEDAKDEVTRYLNESKTELWAVVNNAGIGHSADIELCSMDIYHRVAAVNLFGMIRVTKALLPMIRKSKGRVINVTSVKGRLCVPYDSSYGITKHGAECFSDTLRMEMKKFGVRVVIIEPGEFGSATDMGKGINADRTHREFENTWKEVNQDIRDTYGKEYMYAHLSIEDASSSCITPVIDAFVEAIMNINPKPRYLIDGSPGWIDIHCFYARLYPYLPSSWMDHLIIRWYTKKMPLVKSLQNR
ncbi:hypothetical protein FSP39_002989 [Pinctada imbricata]|uniref:Uncharacterized protein n=1 Tax=Pinctada imbricata TaxID=66713 RepID=A0AA88XQ37_PINIB|nr:hypothetical protein FSP39_002989 [Pinctada imbricata]